MASRRVTATLRILLPLFGCGLANADQLLREQALVSIREAATFFRTEVASHGGYVFLYSVDLEKRWGEGPATPDQIWVQPPGTPTVGMAFLKAYEATGERFYLDAATEAAEALVYGQLESGGWTNSVDFDPRGRTAQYRNGRGKGKNNSSLDDGQTQSAIRLLVRVDQSLAFRHTTIHESARFALDALLAAQFSNGGFPQVWTGPSAKRSVTTADYPDYDWRTKGRIKNYWDMYTLNDNLAGYVARALIDAYRVYGDEKYKRALDRLGDFLIRAQMPEPQPAWAQQYNYEMNPIWARPFEPPAIASHESQDAVESLMQVYRITGAQKFLEPIPAALTYLRRSLLPDGQLSRYYELKTNRPLYMSRRGDAYLLTYDDSDLPKHYAWKIESRIAELEEQYEELVRDGRLVTTGTPPVSVENVREVIARIDDKGRWISTYGGERLVGQPDFKIGYKFIASSVFSRNIELLAEYVKSTPAVRP